MIDVVFISDLHLHPLRQDIKERFDQFIQWAQASVKSIYKEILYKCLLFAWQSRFFTW